MQLKCENCDKEFKKVSGYIEHSKHCLLSKKEREKIKQLYLSGFLIKDIVKTGYKLGQVQSCITERRTYSCTLKISHTKHRKKIVRKKLERKNTEEEQILIDKIYGLYLEGLSVEAILKKGYKNKFVRKALEGKLRTRSEALKLSHKINPEFYKHTKETKDKISKARIKFLEKNPEKVPYKLNHSSQKSWPEEIFERALIRNNVIGWRKRFQVSIYEYDFAFIDEKVDVEIDGFTHTTQKVKEIDKRRDIWSNKNGWDVLRFNASDVIKQPDVCIQKLITFLKTKNYE